MKKKHGHTTSAGYRSPTYKSWSAMKDRCSLGQSKSRNWGQRGIRVCDRWNGPDGFANFLADMGERPPGTSLDRIDNDGNYEPGNCRWASTKQQRRNCRQNTMLTWHGRTQCLVEWAEQLGMTPELLIYRLKHWPLDKAMSTPVKRYRLTRT